MNKRNKKSHICDVIDYKKDIEPYNLIKIYAGVGSGKSYFASAMMTGSDEYRIPEQSVLLITSRRAKVEETLKELGVVVKSTINKNGNLDFDVWQTGEDRPFEYEKYARNIKFNNEFGVQDFLIYNKSAVCTNAFISVYLRNVYEPDNPITHIWNKFDSIIIDEVHSLVTDSTYQSATFDVLALIQEYLKLAKNNQLQECACKHLILMTGTPQPFETFIKMDFPEERTIEKNCFDVCENVVPKNIILADEQTSKLKVKELLSDGKKVIYFTNRTMTEKAAREKFDLDKSINIGVSFSKEDKRKSLPQEEQGRIRDLNDSIAKNSLIPKDIQFFVTTSRNKEGININNKDIHNMFVETHLMYDAVQMAGRVRAGIDIFYIISSAEQYSYENTLTDRLFSKKIMVANEHWINSDDEANKYLINEYFNKAEEKKWEDEERLNYIRKYVNYIESRFSYVRYNVFKQKFEFFYQKENAEELNKAQNAAFDNMILSDSNKLVEIWFPYSSIRREISAKERARKYLLNVIGKEPFVRLSRDELRDHLSVIKEIFNSSLKSIKPILHLVDEKFNYIESGSKDILYYGTENPIIKKKPMKKRRKQ